jgi:hypothetical protein
VIRAWRAHRSPTRSTDRPRLVAPRVRAPDGPCEPRGQRPTCARRSGHHLGKTRFARIPIVERRDTRRPRRREHPADHLRGERARGAQLIERGRRRRAERPGVVLTRTAWARAAARRARGQRARPAGGHRALARARAAAGPVGEHVEGAERRGRERFPNRPRQRLVAPVPRSRPRSTSPMPVASEGRNRNSSPARASSRSRPRCAARVPPQQPATTAIIHPRRMVTSVRSFGSHGKRDGRHRSRAALACDRCHDRPRRERVILQA